jgi:hypothetical protein
MYHTRLKDKGFRVPGLHWGRDDAGGRTVEGAGAVEGAGSRAEESEGEEKGGGGGGRGMGGFQVGVGTCSR